MSPKGIGNIFRPEIFSPTIWEAPVADFSAFDLNSFNNLYINGILQPGNSYDVNPTSLLFPAQSTTIYAGTPIVLEVVLLKANVTV
ncbi:DUF4183 domain-containing protein [Paenibacillus sp. ISL-20]|uniref:DUF4183 domain-containing protein n=1 Tax=Paenibacillus sp. ISL-20 TaxID=2819163 RepID=UPI001BE5D20E|nr:DUF4183 domain-containing protein [Paenibacillus sp. ISL-20]